MEDDLGKIRNLGIMAHIDAGKTTLTERILYYTGKSHKVGEVHYGNTVMDWMEQEQERGITITSASTTCVWKSHQINLIDTPGHVDFTLEVERSLRVLDGAVCVFDAVNGVEPQSETVWYQADKYNVPRICFINKMDRVGADFEMCLESIKEKLSVTPTVLHWPVGSEENFQGVLDVVAEKLVVWEGDGVDLKPKYKDIPSEYIDKSKHLKNALMEQVSEFDDELLEAYLSESSIKIEQIKKAIRVGTIRQKIFPVFCGSALKNKSVQLVLDAVADYLPSPLDVKGVVGVDKSGKEVLCKASFNAPVVSLAFKLQVDEFAGMLTYLRVYSGTLKVGQALENTTSNRKERVTKILKMHANSRTQTDVLKAGDIGAVVGLKWTKTGDTLCDRKTYVLLESIGFPEPVISQAIEPKTSDDEKKLEECLKKIQDEDPSFSFKENQDTGQMLVFGMGELHIEIILDRLDREFGVKVSRGKPQVSYRECVTAQATHREHFERMIGAEKHQATAMVKVEANSGDKNKILNKSSLSENEASFAIQGIEESLENGSLAGNRVISTTVTLLDSGDKGDFVPTELALKVAASKATKKAMELAKPHLLEPVASMEVTVPKDFLGSVVGDLNSKRGKINNVQALGNMQVINAHVPVSEVFGYATTLRSLTSGRGSFSMKISHFERLPEKLESQILYGS